MKEQIQPYIPVAGLHTSKLHVVLLLVPEARVHWVSYIVQRPLQHAR